MGLRKRRTIRRSWTVNKDNEKNNKKEAESEET